MELDPVIDRLFTVPPTQFVKARDACVAEARRAGQRELAATVKGLRRPTSSAWATNLLAHQRQAQLEQLLDLGATMRAAQTNPDATQLRGLSQQGRELVGALITEAKHLASDLGQPLTAVATQEVEATLNAALADADAADELKAGRLVLPLSYTGLGITISEDTGQTRPLSPRAAGQLPAQNVPGREDQHQKRRVTPEAQSALAAAESHVAELERRTHEAIVEHVRCHERVADIERQLEDARSAEERAERALREAQQAQATAEAELATLRREVRRARS